MEAEENGDSSQQEGAHASQDMRTTIPIEGLEGSVGIASTTHRSLDESVKNTFISETYGPQNIGSYVGTNVENHKISGSSPQNASRFSSQDYLNPGIESKLPVQTTAISIQQPTKDQKLMISMPPLPPPSDDPMACKMPALDDPQQDQMPPLESVDHDQIPSLYNPSSHSISLPRAVHSSIVPTKQGLTSVQSEKKVSHRTEGQLNFVRKHVTTGANSMRLNTQESSVSMVANASLKGKGVGYRDSRKFMKKEERYPTNLPHGNQKKGAIHIIHQKGQVVNSSGRKSQAIFVGNASSAYFSTGNEKGRKHNIFSEQQNQMIKKHAEPLHNASKPFRDKKAYARDSYGSLGYQGGTGAPKHNRLSSSYAQIPRVEGRKSDIGNRLIHTPPPPTPNPLSSVQPISLQRKSNLMKQSILESNKDESKPITASLNLTTATSRRSTTPLNSKGGEKFHHSLNKDRNKRRTKFYKLATALHEAFVECWDLLKKFTSPNPNADEAENKILMALFSQKEISSATNLGMIHKTLMAFAYNQSEMLNDVGLKDSLMREYNSLEKVGLHSLSKIEKYHKRISELNTSYDVVFLESVSKGIKSAVNRTKAIKKVVEETVSDIDRLIKVNVKRGENNGKRAGKNRTPHGKISPVVGEEFQEKGSVTNLQTQNLQSGSGRKRKRTSKFVDDIEDEMTGKEMQPKRNDVKEVTSDENTAEREFRKAFQAMTRRLSKRTNITTTIADNSPNRTSNPLLEIAKYPQTSTNGILPHGTEFWKLISLYYPRPDTFPISYYARILGFDLPITADKPGVFSKFNPKMLPFKEGCEAMNVPRLGRFSPYLSAGSNRNEVNDFIAPKWKSFLQYKPSNHPQSLCVKDFFASQECIKYGKEVCLLGDEIEFRLAETGDAETLFHFNAVRVEIF